MDFINCNSGIEIDSSTIDGAATEEMNEEKFKSHLVQENHDWIFVGSSLVSTIFETHWSEKNLRV